MKIDEDLIKELFKSELKKNFADYSIRFRGRNLNITKIDKLQILNLYHGKFHDDYNYEVSGRFELTIKNEETDSFKIVPNLDFRTYIQVENNKITKCDNVLCITSQNQNFNECDYKG